MKIISAFIILSGFTSLVTPASTNWVANQCVFKNPDTSVAGIKIRDDHSVELILGKNSRLAGDSTHHYFSKNKKQVLSLTVHPGDGDNYVSIFKVSYSITGQSKIRPSNVASFDTEKGIHLGMSKSALIGILGKCFARRFDKQWEVISYKIESPYDNKSRLLERHNMPVYYGSYHFRKDKLEEFEFGFEYP